MQPLFFSSGDLLADRRYDYARAVLAEGDRAGAAELLTQALERAPGFASAWFLLGELREKDGACEAAIHAFRQALDADPEDRHGAALRLARLGDTPPPAEMPPAYVRSLFDQYAPRFDQALTEDLAYRGPALLFEAVREACSAHGRARAFGRVIDLGCGTGLAGEAFAACVDTLVGVDLSPEMAAQARRRGCYRHLHVADMLDFLHGEGGDSADLVTAADAFVYLGDLAPLLAEAARVLDDGGLIAFTLETHDGEGVILGEKLRYAHAPGHVSQMLDAAGLDPVILRHASTRLEGNMPVPGLLVVAERRNRPPAWVED